MGWAEAIQAIVAVAGAASSRNSAKGAKISYDDAYRQAVSEVGNTWENTLNNTLKNLKNDQIARGVYGQLNSDALTQSTAANIEAQKAANISSLANAIMSNSQERYDNLTSQANSALANAGNSVANALGNSNYSIDWEGLKKKENKTKSETGSTGGASITQYKGIF